MAKNYRMVERGELDEAKACKRAYLLDKLREAIVFAIIEPRLSELEDTHLNDAFGFQGATPARLNS